MAGSVPAQMPAGAFEMERIALFQLIDLIFDLDDQRATEDKIDLFAEMRHLLGSVSRRFVSNRGADSPVRQVSRDPFIVQMWSCSPVSRLKMGTLSPLGMCDLSIRLLNEKPYRGIQSRAQRCQRNKGRRRNALFDLRDEPGRKTRGIRNLFQCQTQILAASPYLVAQGSLPSAPSGNFTSRGIVGHIYPWVLDQGRAPLAIYSENLAPANGKPRIIMSTMIGQSLI